MKYLIIIYLCGIFSAANLVASPVMDDDQLKNLSEKEKVKILYKLSRENRYQHPQKAFEYAEQLKELSEHINDENGLIKAHFMLGFLFDKKQDPAKAIASYLACLKLSYKYPQNQWTLITFKNIAEIFYRFSDYTTSLNYYQQSLNIALKKNDLKRIAELYQRMGTINRIFKKYDRAESLYFKAIELYKKLNNNHKIPELYLVLGILYNEWGKNNIAIDQYQKSITLAKGLSIENYIVTSVNNNIGKIAILFFPHSLYNIPSTKYSSGIL